MLMPSMKAMVSIALLASSPSLAAETPIRISCSHTSQAGFDNAVALMEQKPPDGRRMFQEMSRKDRDCAILFWGIAMSAANSEERQDASLCAIVTAVIAGVNDDEWRRIVALP
jgi:hypothetical protein